MPAPRFTLDPPGPGRTRRRASWDFLALLIGRWHLAGWAAAGFAAYFMFFYYAWIALRAGEYFGSFEIFGDFNDRLIEIGALVLLAVPIVVAVWRFVGWMRRVIGRVRGEGNGL